jgi:hypothetical protein
MVHAIDKVMLATGANIVASAQAGGGEYSKPEPYILVAAVVKSGLAGTLSDPNNNFTIYAPRCCLYCSRFSKCSSSICRPAATLQFY